MQPVQTLILPMLRNVARLSRLAAERAISSHDQIAAVLGTEILLGIHRPGANMPPEPELIERFQVSRTVMREVMKTLTAKGFVTAKTRIGTRVLDPSNWNYFDADVLAWRVRIGLDDEFRLALTEVRRAIEPVAAGLAARRRTPADILALRDHVASMAQSGHTRESFAEVDLEFHLAIAAASGNPLMRSVAGVIEAALVASFTQSSPVDDASDHEHTLNIHSSIVDAIEARDEQAAATAMLEAIDIGHRRINDSNRKRARKR
jgi:DNA-binding FadR family transcriptional regulator